MNSERGHYKTVLSIMSSGRVGIGEVLDPSPSSVEMVKKIGMLITLGWDQDESEEDITAQAASLIDGMKAALLREAAGWISVEERLPENDIEVLFALHEYNNEKNPLIVTTGKRVGGEFFDSAFHALYPPTHWMPLPPPPAGKEEQ